MEKAHRTITPRKLNWDFSNTPIIWFRDNPLFTHYLNTYTLLVPDNEKYYIRALQACLGDVSSPELRRTIHRFCQQESMHGVAHKKYWHRMEAGGIPTAPFVKGVDILLYRILEKLQPRPIKLSIVAAIEHINASWGHAFLEGDWLRDADPSLRRLFYWHFAEEIEHKAVVDDVLRDLYPAYLIRAAGALIAFPMFMLLTVVGTLYLLFADKQLLRFRTWRKVFADAGTLGFLRMMWREFLRYLKPGFRPWDRDDYYLAERVLNTTPARAEAEDSQETLCRRTSAA